jgi:hypothetical protein
VLAFPPKRTDHDHGKTNNRNCPGPPGCGALSFVIPNRNKEEEKADQDWHPDHDIAFDSRWDKGKQPEVPEKIPIWFRIGRQYARIRRLI